MLIKYIGDNWKRSMNHMIKKGLIAITLLCLVGMASGNAAFDQNKALKSAGNSEHPGTMALSGVSSEIFNFGEFQQGPLNSRRLPFDDIEWQSAMQGYEYDGMVWSIRDFIDYQGRIPESVSS
jgi:hypothetical protein